MKTAFLLLLLIMMSCGCIAQTQKDTTLQHVFDEKEKYFSFNPFGLLEPQMAVGAGFGNRFSERSEYFTELSYILTSPFFNKYQHNKLNGYRFLAQYRYHFLQRWRPLIKFLPKDNATQRREAPWAGPEFRIKGYNFSGNYTFINKSSGDTLTNYLYNAGAVSIGGALVFGNTFELSKDGKWKIEITSGLGAKVKFVKYKNIPPGYTPLYRRGGFGFSIPGINKASGSPYFPFCIRIKYLLN